MHESIISKYFVYSIEYLFILYYNNIMKIGVYTNLNKDRDCLTAKSLLSILQRRGISYKFYSDKKQESDTHEKLRELTDGVDLLVAFGGDGTMLNIVPYCAVKGIPMLGVNLGHLGFLTEVNADMLEDTVDRLVDGDYFCEKRSMIEVINGENRFIALNEVVLSKTENSNICNIAVDIDGIRADKVRADGVMVSTPTGSTGYSLSCNGSILSPDLDALIINAICPHSLHFCPIVISDSSTVDLSSDGTDLRLTIDGKIMAFVEDPQKITIKKCDHTATFIRFEKSSFYSRLIKKLAYWGE